MGASIREIVNTNNFPFHSAMSNPIEINNISEDVNMDVPRSRSTALSPNSSRESSTHSDLSSQLYADRMEAENEKLPWDEQVESQNFQLSYQSIQQGTSNDQDKANRENNMSSTSSLGKNLSQYSPIGAWLVMAQVAQVHSEFEKPNCLIQGPPFV